MNGQGRDAEQGERDSNPLLKMVTPQIIGYNSEEGCNSGENERLEGIKARFKIRVEIDGESAVLEERQAEAIRELLLWARQHRTRSQPDQ